MPRKKGSANNSYKSYKGLLSLSCIDERYRIYYGKISQKICGKRIFAYTKERDLGKALELMNRIEAIIEEDIAANSIDVTFEKYKPERLLQQTRIKTYREYIEHATELYFQQNKKTESKILYLKETTSMLRYHCKEFLEDVVTVENLTCLATMHPHGSSKRERLIKALRILTNYDTNLASMLNKSGFNYSKYTGSYSPKIIRIVPTDEEIFDRYHIFTEVKKRTKTSYSANFWGWVYGMLATYGLRAHELTRLILEPSFIDDNHTIHIDADTKTGYRVAHPLMPEWVDFFGLRDIKDPSKASEILGILSSMNPRGKNSLSKTVTWRFSPKGKNMPFKAYDLRHAYAVRGLRLNIPIAIMAKSMGHSVKMHEKVYQYFASVATKECAFREALNNSLALQSKDAAATKTEDIEALTRENLRLKYRIRELEA